MRPVALLLTLCISACQALPHKYKAQNTQDLEAIAETNRRVRAAFLAEDLPTILLYHHPEVEKFLGWDDVQRGHADMEKALSSFFESYRLEFFNDESTPMESLRVFADTAVMVRKFKLRGTPKQAGQQNFVFHGRTLIVYQRYNQSPTGWVTIREILMRPDTQ